MDEDSRQSTQWRAKLLASLQERQSACDRSIEEFVHNFLMAAKRGDDVRSEFRNQTDRGAGIIGAALVEAQLPLFIGAHLANRTKETLRLFNRGQALENFGAQIALAYAIGLVSHDVYCDLDRIREIRNKFSHSIWIVQEDKKKRENPRPPSKILVTFEQEKIKGWALGLKYPKALESLTEDLGKQCPTVIRSEPQQFFLALTPRAKYEITCETLHLMLATGQHVGSSVPLRYQTKILPSQPIATERSSR